jgi:hypothetical protein
MAEQITYYAIFDEDSSPERPAGVFRRVKDGEGQTDEVFSRNLRWEFSPLLYSTERGDTTYDFAPINAEEADRIVNRIRAQAAPGASG